jgi:hypothetical protein
VIIHISSNLTFGWRFARGVPPYTFAEETVVDLVRAATDLNDVIAYVTGGFAKKRVSEGRLREVTTARKNYEKYKLIVELDGKQYHPLEHRGRGQDRDNDATATVGSTLRHGWVDVPSKRCGSARQVHAALARRGYAGPFTPCSPTCAAFADAADRQARTPT